MKKRRQSNIVLPVIIVILLIALILLCIAFFKKDTKDSDSSSTSSLTTEAISEEKSDTKTLTEEKALSAIKSYCYKNNPDLKSIEEAGEYPVYWDVSTNENKEIVVLFRSYTGSQTRYYIDQATGNAYVTEFVPGITDEEERKDETFNVWDYAE